MEKDAVKTAVLTRIGLTKALYKKGLVRAAITKTENMNLFAATITFLENESENDLTLDYDSLILVQRCLGVDDAIKIIEDLIDRQVFIYDGVEIPVTGSWDEARFVPSRYRWGVLDCDNPRLNVSFRLQSPGPLPPYPLVSPGLPLYPEGRKAVLDFLEMHIANPDAVIAIQIPDYRAKIDNMKISGKKVTLTIESRISDQLVAKFYADADKEGDYSRSLLYFMKSKDQDIISNTIEYEFPNHFDSVTVAISGKSSNDPLDYREYDFRWQTGEGVEVDRGEEDIKELISRGENLNVEYKQILEPREFLETVVAFANTKGGVIFLGVNDNCQIVGCREDASKITNLITSNLDPRPRFSVKHVQIDEKPITMVEIPEGDNKPYVHRERGPYVRSNSNDRPPTRAEIDDFYKKNNRPF